jgi:GYF domain 2/PilZ domain
MADNWYYVQKGNRHGPVAVEVVQAMMTNEELKGEDFVWKKGFENWKKLKEVPELQPQKLEEPVEVEAPPSVATAPYKDVSLKDLGADDRVIFIRIGNDRGGSSTDYGPFNLKQIKQLFKENRINGKTFIFTSGMKEWKVLGDVPEYQELFEELPPVIADSDRRTGIRKPFVARLFVQNNKNLYEGICRDISVGGMQILIDNFQGKAGDKISLNVHPENTDYHFTAAGVVVRVLEGNAGFSFRFHGLNDEAKRSIERYIQDN